MSDIVGNPMSHNDPIKDILQDLIKDIVGQDGEGHEITMGDNDECLICKYVDRAESRLRELESD